MRSLPARVRRGFSKCKISHKRPLGVSENKGYMVRPAPVVLISRRELLSIEKVVLIPIKRVIFSNLF